jgi:hypothetical protein
VNKVSYDAPAKDIIVAVRELFTDPAKWVKKTSRQGDAMCLAYAVLFVTGTTDESKKSDIVLDKVSKALGFEMVGSMVTFNDMSLTTHAKLLERLDRAIGDGPTVN